MSMEMKKGIVQKLQLNIDKNLIEMLLLIWFVIDDLDIMNDEPSFTQPIMYKKLNLIQH